MDLVGEFHKEEIDGKPFFVYQNIMKPQIDTPISEIAIDSNDSFLLQPLFLCPRFRTRILLDLLADDEVTDSNYTLLSKFETSPLYDDTSNGHYVLPLFWCNNKEVDSEGEDCYSCSIQTTGTDYYFCVECDKRFHKECVESPLQISHPSHPHSLQLFYSKYRFDHCMFCKKRATYQLYYCALSNSYMHVVCAQAKIPFFINQPKRHDHTLTLFPRQACLTCNICALVNRLYFTYVCVLCDFVAHSDCINIPQTIRISRHSHHRVSFTSSLPLVKLSCGVCRKEIDNSYGAYACSKCNDYAVHTRCALRRDIWDGIELEGVPDDEDVQPSFEWIADGVILHFSHGCFLKLKSNKGVYKKEKFCEACVLPIYEENFYVCVGCNFILHERCAYAPLKMVHPLHPHPLVQTHESGILQCEACNRNSNGVGYVCTNKGCEYVLDIVCASVSEPFKYQGHQHSLFLALDPEEKPICHICKSTEVQKVLNCIECGFIICFECATLPYRVKYKHDEHYLTFFRGDEASETDWCELCEKKLAIGGEKGFYQCNGCCTTLHIDCLFGPQLYMKPGLVLSKDDFNAFLVRNSSASRPICGVCNIHCPYPVYLEFRERTSTTSLCETYCLASLINNRYTFRTIL